MRIDAPEDLDRLAFDPDTGLLPVVAQHALTGETLMLAWADRDALERTLLDGCMWYRSRSRDALWRKGATSGNTQRLVSLHADCDRDAVLARLLPDGPSCHEGSWSCFDAPPTLAALDAVLADRAADPAANGYTRRLLDDPNLRLKKIGEEAVELALACAAGDPGQAAEEAADVIYHVLVACRAAGVGTSDVLRVLEARGAGGRRIKET